MTSWSRWSEAREWLSSLRLVSHPVSKCNNFWQIWCLSWKWVRDVLMCLVFLWLNLFLSFFFEGGTITMYIEWTKRKQINKCVWSGLAVWLNQSPDRHTQPSLCFSGSSVFGRKIIKKGKRRKSSGFRVGEQGVWITASPLRSEPNACLSPLSASPPHQRWRWGSLSLKNSPVPALY